MTNYLKKYKKALRDGDKEKANEFYRKYKGSGDEDQPSSGSEDEGGDSFEGKVTDPEELTVGEAKDEFGQASTQVVEKALELEKEGKDRKTLVDFLEGLVD